MLGGEHLDRVVVSQTGKAQAGQALEDRCRRLRLPQAKEQDDPLGVEASRGEGERFGGGAVQPLGVVDNGQDGRRVEGPAPDG